ncbi:unnamed protein product [Rhizophagus irregularis]|nr:unnamed protein product [Rhizophagus irregularis]
MTVEKKTIESNSHINWVENAFTENYIKYYDYSNFTNIEEIDNNSFGKILRANWKETDIRLIIKSSNKLTIKEIINEIKIQREVDFHPNILRFYGISKSVNQMDKYSLVLECADGGSMSSYLKKNFDKLGCNDKYHFALQLASAVEFIHNEEIIHCGLHARNVFIHNNIIKLANFDLSKKISEASEHILTGLLTGLLPYMDPKYLNNKFNVKDETCWSYDPDNRPSIQQVILSLKSMIFQESDNKKEIMYEENDDEFDSLVFSDFILDHDLEDEFIPYIIKQAEIEI